MGGSSLFLFSKVVQTPHRKGPSLNLTQELSCCEVTVLNTAASFRSHIIANPLTSVCFLLLLCTKCCFFCSFKIPPWCFKDDQVSVSVGTCSHDSFKGQLELCHYSHLKKQNTHRHDTYRFKIPQSNNCHLFDPHNDTLDTWDRLQQRTFTFSIPYILVNMLPDYFLCSWVTHRLPWL